MNTHPSTASPGIRPDEPSVVTDIPRTAPETVRGFAAHGVATVHEANRRRGLMTGLASVVPGERVAGPAVTCLCHAGDNLMLHAALAQCEPGDVLVVTTLAPSTHGMFGELLATSCRARGIAGIVIDAGVRDAADLRAMPYPVWSRAISAAGTTKHTAGWVNVSVVCGGVTVSPGDLVVADDDGVMVVDRRAAPGVLVASRQREEREARARQRFLDGELSLDTNNLRPVLDDLGVRFVPGTPTE